MANDKAGSFDEGFKAVCRKIAPEATVGSAEDVGKGSWDLVVACGGDGTVRVVVNAMIQAESQASLGIVPLGTANVVSRVFDLPKEPEEALKVALGPDVRRIDVGLCNGEAFLLGCGLGLAERFVTTVGHEEKRRLGPLAYARKFLAERNTPPVKFRIEGVPGTTELEGVGLVVANVAQLGESVRPFGDVRPDDGRLTLIVLHRTHVVDLLRLGWKGLFGKAAEDKAVDLLRTSKCRIASEPKVPIQIDGDEVEQTAPFEFEVLPERLSIKVRADN